MANSMLAYRLTAWERPPEVVEIPVPSPGPGEVLIKVAGNGLCHSDIAMQSIPASFGPLIGWEMPFTLGHEIGGWIDRIGDGVTGWATGDKVVLVSMQSDGTCEFCLRGHDNACPAGTAGRGYGRDGGLAPFVVARASRDLIRLASMDPATAGPLTDAGATSYHAVKRVLPKLTPGSHAVVIGAGGLGSFAVQFLRVLSPATVTVVDANPARLAYAIELGAHHTVEGVDPLTTRSLREITGSKGADAVLDFVGIDSTIAAGLSSVRTLGSFGLVGAGGGSLNQPLMGSLPRGGEMFTFQGGCISDIIDVISLVESGLVRNDVELFTFDRVAEAYEKMEHGELRGRAVVVPSPPG
jgi:propanol-preferring alcohol dehydrogenase